MDLEAEILWLRKRFSDLSVRCGEDRNTREEHDVEDAKERARADRVLNALLTMVRRFG